ncbi:PD-(D/E)XK nuclease family protein [Corynebacterium pacaense]|uniref:PD-(D/E)XK nuclease family protein n=1 Tax=Corynebacterium pacaense TaxID=1816684 RepID=UPI0009BB36F6|nr:PD-(D/E)XK nuclease family protein [Corynebacterium pacaense]
MPEYQPFIPPDPEVRLVSAIRRQTARTWEGDPAHLIGGGVGSWRVLGEAGSGVSSLLIDTVVERIRQGWDPSEILVVATSREAASRLRRELSEQVSAMNYVSDGPLVRSLHSLAFALIRDASDGDVRLITGAEQDAVIRELLRGQADDGRGSWPPEQREGLRMVGFARQLRDFLLRAVERGIGPEELVELGSRHNRPNWSAAGEFLREYRQIMGLSGAHSYSASELVCAALAGPEPRVHYRGVFVDDAQHLDPKSAELISRFLPAAELAVIAGDPRQSVFHFRGANSEFLTGVGVDHELNLGASRRAPERRVVIAETESAHNDVIADAVRRAHLIDGVEWSGIAVIVRSSGMIAPVRRVLLAAGVPVHVNPTDVVLSEQRIVAAMILGLRSLSEQLTPLELEDLLLGPIGGADPVTLRRLLRGLRQAEMRAGGHRRAIEVLRGMLDSGPDTELTSYLTEREIELLTRVRSVVQAGRAALGGSLEEVLWAVWQATGLSERLAASSLRGGAAGSQADRDLDAMMSLFDAAGDYVERRPTASLRSFILHINEQELPTGVRERRGVTPEAVSVVTAHSTTGMQWRKVVVAGVQEGSWPSLGETGTLLGQEELVDLVDEGIDPDIIISRSAERLAEERRLFHVAVTRASESVLITATDAPDGDEVREPSRFLEELGVDVERSVGGGDTTEIAAAPESLGHRLLSVPALVAELRRAVGDGAGHPGRRRQAARQLARLAEHGVPGADPAEWTALRTPSTDEELVAPGRVSLSPSRIEALINCPLRAGLSSLDEKTPVAMLKGTLIHAYAEVIAQGAEPERAADMVTEAFMDLAAVPAWSRERTEGAFRRTLERTRTWLLTSRSAFTEVAVEVPVSVDIDGEVRIGGRMDRLERNGEGELVIVDLKTGTSMPSKNSMVDHAQLSAYQLALSRGVLHGRRIEDPEPGETPDAVGGGVLVFPASDSRTIATREQVAKTPEELDAFAATLPGLAHQRRGPRLLARANATCSNCPIRGICPVQPEGQLIHD